ncbi:MAG: transglutaminase domain-containing protein [Candidatus Latescibacterota bacterium]
MHTYRRCSFTFFKVFTTIAAIIMSVALSLVSSPPAQEGPPLERRRTGTPDSLAANVPASLVKSVTADPERKLPDLVSYLAKGSDDPFLTVKRIHDWIALNIVYDTTVPYGGKPPQQIWASVLAERKGVCSGYANLFREMTKLAGFACESVGGYARGIDYDLFTEAENRGDNHAWNVITIGDRRYFVDCTWDAGIVNQSGYTPRYSTAFLFLEPEKMVYSHYPSDPTFQLLSTPLPAVEFLKLPVLKSEFFASGLALETAVARMTAADDRFTLRVRVPEGMLLTAALFEHGGIEMKNRAFVRNSDGNATVSVVFPRRGEFVLRLFARRFDSPKKDYTLCAEFGFFAAKGSEDRFPSLFSDFVERGCVLHSPLMSPLRIGSAVTVKITAPGAKNVGANIRGKILPFERASEKDTFEKKITVPFSRELVIAAEYGESGSFSGLVRFEAGK